eukprot:scaffold29_cov251-Pinguiococcus_pyrenoidosus.AAC.58
MEASGDRRDRQAVAGRRTLADCVQVLRACAHVESWKTQHGDVRDCLVGSMQCVSKFTITNSIIYSIVNTVAKQSLL